MSRKRCTGAVLLASSGRLCLDEGMNIFERVVGGRRYRVASQSVWDARNQRPGARQVVLGPADPPPPVDLANTRVVGHRSLGDVGALLWIAEQLDVIGTIDKACGSRVGGCTPSVGEMVLAVALQRTCRPGSKRELGDFLAQCLPKASCLKPAVFNDVSFHRTAKRISKEQIDAAQIVLAETAVSRFGLSANVLAFDTTNFDTFISTRTKAELSQRGHAKSKRRDLRVVGLGVLASETGHVPLFHCAYPGNQSDQTVLRASFEALSRLHDALDRGQNRRRRLQRTIVRDGGSWGEQLELDFDAAGYFTLVSLPLGHSAAKAALADAAHPRKMKKLKGALSEVRAARMRTSVGDLDRTLVVVESQELLRGQKRGIARALQKAKKVLTALEKRAKAGRITKASLEQAATKALAREHLSEFVVARTTGTEDAPRFRWHVDTKKRQDLERTRLGRRILCTDRHGWSTERIVRAFRGQWNVEELFRRAKRGGISPWGPSHHSTDESLRLHTFATVLGLTLVSLARSHLGEEESPLAMMASLRAVRTTMVRTSTGAPGRRPTYQVLPELTQHQRRAVRAFELDRWLPGILSSSTGPAPKPVLEASA